MFLLNYYWQHCAQCKVPVFKLLRGILRFFAPTGATGCTDGGEIWHGGVLHAKFHLISATIRIQDPKN